MGLTDALRARIQGTRRSVTVRCASLGDISAQGLPPRECAALSRGPDGDRSVLYAASRELQAAGETLRKEGAVFTPDQIMQFVSDEEARLGADAVRALSGAETGREEAAPGDGEKRAAGEASGGGFEEPGESAGRKSGEKRASGSGASDEGAADDGAPGKKRASSGASGKGSSGDGASDKKRTPGDRTSAGASDRERTSGESTSNESRSPAQAFNGDSWRMQAQAAPGAGTPDGRKAEGQSRPPDDRGGPARAAKPAPSRPGPESVRQERTAAPERPGRGQAAPTDSESETGGDAISGGDEPVGSYPSSAPDREQSPPAAPEGGAAAEENAAGEASPEERAFGEGLLRGTDSGGGIPAARRLSAAAEQTEPPSPPVSGAALPDGAKEAGLSRETLRALAPELAEDILRRLTEGLRDARRVR